MTQPRHSAGLCILAILPAEQGEDGVAEGEYAADSGAHGQSHERGDARPKEEQPHAPTGNRFRQIHFTRSFVNRVWQDCQRN